MSNLDKLLRDLVADEPRTERSSYQAIQGTITAVNATTPPTVDVDLVGGVVPGLRYPQGSAPAVGAAVWVAVQGGRALYVSHGLAAVSGDGAGGGGGTGPQGPAGATGETGATGPAGPQTAFVQATQPTSAQLAGQTTYLWVQTGLGPDGTGVTFWIEDGAA